MKNKNLINIIKSNKISKQSKDSIIEDIKQKLKKIDKYFRLEELKNEEKIYRMKDNFIDPEEKPNFYFMRSLIKTEKYKSSNYGDSYKNRENNTLGLKNFKLKRHLQTQIYPKNFDDIISEIEFKKIKNDLQTHKYFLNDKNYINNSKTKKPYLNYRLNTDGNKNRKSYTKNDNVKSRNVINTLKIKKGKNHTFSAYYKENEDLIGKEKILKNNYESINGSKRPITSRYGTKYFNIKDYENNSESEHNLNNYKQNLIKLQKRGVNINFNHTLSRNSFLNKSKNNSSFCTTTFKSYSKSLSKRSKNNTLLKNIEKQVLNPESFYSSNNNNNYMENSEGNELKTINQIINRILNDGKIIDKYISKKGINKKDKIDKEEILLKLEEKLRRSQINKIKVKLKNKKYLNDEEMFKDKLSHISPKYARNFFYEVYKQILNEKRLLNKNEKSSLAEAIEDIKKKKKREDNFKKEVIAQMLITKDNIITEKDDKDLLKEQKKLFDNYGNLEGLEWLINKRYVINYGKKFVGAFNPKGKTHLKITYKNIDKY